MHRVLAALGRHKGWSIGGGVFVVLVVIGGINSAVDKPAANSGAQAAASSPAAVSAPVPVASTPAVASSSAAPAVASSSPAPPPPPSPSPAPSVLVADNPAFDPTGSGDACRMHYFQDSQGRTVTLFDLAQDGELITHVSGPPGIGRHDQQETRGVSRIVYDFPLSQATDMGAVLYLADGTQQSCTISAGSDVP